MGSPFSHFSSTSDWISSKDGDKFAGSDFLSSDTSKVLRNAVEYRETLFEVALAVLENLISPTFSS